MIGITSVNDLEILEYSTWNIKAQPIRPVHPEPDP